MQTSHYIAKKEEKKRKRRGFFWTFFFHVGLAVLALYPFLVINEELEQPGIEIQFQNYDWSETLAAGDDGGEAESNDAEEFSEEIEDPEGLESEDPVVEEVNPAPAEEAVEEVVEEVVEETVEETVEEVVEETVEEVAEPESTPEPIPEPEPTPEPKTEPTKDILTAENEEAAIRAKKEKEKAELEAKLKAETEARERAEAEAKKKAELEAKKKAELEAKKKAKAEAKKKAAEAKAKRKAAAEAKRKAAAAKAKKSSGAPGGTGSDSGKTKTEGSKKKKNSGGGGQGKKKTGPGKGTPGKGKADSGSGGSGGKAEFGRKLMRSVKNKPSPGELKSLAGNATGRVVFNLCINPDGRIIYLKYNSKRTTIKDKRIIKNVQTAMKRYRFKRDYKAPQKECGQFTFSFDRFD